MKTNVTTTERTFDFKDLSEREAHALYAMLNKNDEYLREVADGNATLLEDWFESSEDAVGCMMKVRDEVLDAVGKP